MLLIEARGGAENKSNRDSLASKIVSLGGKITKRQEMTNHNVLFVVVNIDEKSDELKNNFGELIVGINIVKYPPN